MSTKKSKHASSQTPTPEPMGQEDITVYESIVLATTDLDLADVVQLFKLPAGCIPVSYIIGATDMDTGAAPVLAADFGILDSTGLAISAAAADGGAKWLTGLTIGVAAAITLSTGSKATYDILKAVTASTVDRTVALVISAAAQIVASGTIECEFKYKSVN
jgi:hypothetical protein